ncbi:MAG: hypothetical protein R3F56_08460 [Planctomycetota bacterium]
MIDTGGRTSPTAARAAERGMNLVETMLVLLTLSIMSAMIINSMRRFTSAHAYSEGQARVSEVGDRVVRQMSDDAAFASHVFTTAGFASAYLAKCDLTGLTLFNPVAPTATEKGYFEKDVAGSPATGNFLLMAKAAEPFLADLVGDRSQIVSATTYRLLLYGLVSQPDQNIDVARWVSQKLARLNDIERITSPVSRTVLCQKLYDKGFRFAWEPGRAVAAGLMAITASGSLRPLNPTERIPGENAELRSAMLKLQRMSVARNGTLPTVAVPAYAIANGDFPGGFEVKVDGNAQGRMILLRLVVVGVVFDGNRNAVVFSRTMSNRGTM